jgi:hypothetical protein
MNSENSELHFKGISLSNEAIKEGQVLQIRRKDIQSTHLSFGASEERPLAMIVFGILFIGIGLLPVKHIISWFLEGGTLVDLELAMLASIIPGVGLIAYGVRRRFFLLVNTGTDKRKLVFDSTTQKSDVEQFIQQARSQFQFEIHSNI